MSAQDTVVLNVAKGEVNPF